jgi:hypothetical protein
MLQNNMEDPVSSCSIKLKRILDKLVILMDIKFNLVGTHAVVDALTTLR